MEWSMDSESSSSVEKSCKVCSNYIDFLDNDLCNVCSKKLCWGCLKISDNKLCDRCINLRNQILNNDIDSSLIYSNYEVEVEYTCYKKLHSEYCDKYIYENDGIIKITHKYPLLKLFKNWDLDNDGKIISGPLILYQRDTSKCVCGYILEYETMNCIVVKKNWRKIHLPE